MRERFKQVFIFKMIAFLLCLCLAGPRHTFAQDLQAEESQEESTLETAAEGTAESQAEYAVLPPENRLIVRTDSDISGIAHADAQIAVEGGYILSFDSEQECTAALDRLSGAAAVETAEEDTYFMICRETAAETAAVYDGYSETELPQEETADSNLAESETESAAETVRETEAEDTETETFKDETESIERETERTDTKKAKRPDETDLKVRTDETKEKEADADLVPDQMDPAGWRKKADQLGKKLLILIDTGSDQADERISLTGDSPADGNGHGNEMTSLIRQTSGQEAYIVSVKAINDEGKGRLSDVYTAVSLALQSHADVVNLSISARDSGEMEGLKSLLSEAAETGISIVCAAGNHCLEADQYCPGNCPDVLTIGSCDSLGMIGPHSNYGKAIDFFAAAESTSEGAAMVSGYICRYGVEGLASLPEIFLPDQAADPLAVEAYDTEDDDLFHISADALQAGAVVKLNGAYNVGPAVYASDSTYLAEYTFRIGGSTGYCGNIAAARGAYASASGTRNYVAGVYDFTDVGGKDVNYIVKQVYSENKNYVYNGRTIDGTLLRKILYYSDGAPGDTRFNWASFEKGYAENSYVFSDLPGSNRQSDPNRSKYTKSNAYRKGVVSCACSYIWGQEMGLCTVNASSSTKTYIIGKRYVDAIRNLPAPPEAFTAYFAVLSGEYGLDTSMSVVQPVLFWTARDTEQIRIKKTVSFTDQSLIKPDPFHPADQYSPKGLVFGVYRDKACKDLAARLTIGSADAQGNYYSGWVSLKHGSYYIKEIDNSSNKNIKINTQVTGITVEMNDLLYPQGKRTIDIGNQPETGALQIKKLIVDSTGEDIGDIYSAEGVRFALYTAQTEGRKLAELTIGKRGADGAYVSNVLEHIAYGTYYLQEISLSESLSDAGAVLLKDRVKCQIIPGKLNSKGVFVAEIKNYAAKPSIGTSAEDMQTGSREALADSLVEIVDHVSYENLIPGREYQIKGVLMDRESKSVLQADGKEVRQTAVFKPEKASGEIELVFRFDGRQLCNRKLVVFEELHYGERILAEHKEYEDKKQQINMSAPGSITLTKVAEGNNAPLEGVVFRITDQNGKAVKDISGHVLSEKKTGKDGKVQFSDLPYGEYLIEEISTQAGYNLLSQPLKVTLPLSCSEKEARQRSIDLQGAFYSEKEDIYYLTDLKYNVSDSVRLVMPKAGWAAYGGGAAGLLMIMSAALVLCLHFRKIRYTGEA